jgi:hypothetical protein
MHLAASVQDAAHPSMKPGFALGSNVVGDDAELIHEGGDGIAIFRMVLKQSRQGSFESHQQEMKFGPGPLHAHTLIEL